MRRCAAYTTSRGARAFTASISRDHRAIKRASGPASAPVASVLIRRVKSVAVTANPNDAYDADATATRDHRAMKRALELARDAGARGEIPIGAVLIDDETGETLAEASNERAIAFLDMLLAMLPGACASPRASAEYGGRAQLAPWA